MAKKIFLRGRRKIQLFYAALSNSFVTGFVAGKIYGGNLKALCTPGLNCYSCPGAVLSCPIGSLQAVIGSSAFNVSLYVFGLITLFGSLLGRFVCGFLCPFGLFQELIYKIPFFKKINKFKLDKPLRKLKFIILIIFVIMIPMLMNDASGNASPAFCKYVCPVGALEGAIPLVGGEKLKNAVSRGNGAVGSKDNKNETAKNAAELKEKTTKENADLSKGLSGFSVSGGAFSNFDENKGAYAGAGFSEAGYKTGYLFWNKMGILLFFTVFSLINYRPFCKYVCPLGALYGAANKFSLYRLRFSRERCIGCGKCSRACNMLIDPTKNQNSVECVRCGDCVNACPVDALSLGFGEDSRFNLIIDENNKN